MDQKDQIEAHQEALAFPTQFVIPEISDDKLEELYSHIKPIVLEDRSKYTLREFTSKELRKISYLDGNRMNLIDPNELEIIQDFPCLHKCGHYQSFIPSIADVLSQIPEDVACEADYFEIVERPERFDDVGKFYIDIMNQGFHLSRVRAYKLKSKE